MCVCRSAKEQCVCVCVYERESERTLPCKKSLQVRQRLSTGLFGSRILQALFLNSNQVLLLYVFLLFFVCVSVYIVWDKSYFVKVVALRDWCSLAICWETCPSGWEGEYKPNRIQQVGNSTAAESKNRNGNQESILWPIRKAIIINSQNVPLRAMYANS